MTPMTIVLAAGGTGGHIFPAEAIASALANKGYKVVFITDKAGRKFDRLPLSVQVMSLPMYRRNNSITGIIKFLWGLIRSIYHTYRGFKIMKPTVVVGFGGYPSFPAVFVAQILRIPTVIHEQNAVLGQVNRILGRRAKHVALSFNHTRRVGRNMPTTITGTPVREVFHMFRATTYTAFGAKDPIRILITGGSQGARVFSTVIPKAIFKLPLDMRQRLSIVHQCPKEDVERLQLQYKECDLQAKVVDFIEDMAEEMSAAHLIIARSGASTLAELAMIGRPAILVPFPAAKDNHQWVNAQTIETAKAGWCVDQEKFTADYLATRLEALIKTPESLYEAAIKMKALGRTTATEQIINLIIDELKKD